MPHNVVIIRNAYPAPLDLESGMALLQNTTDNQEAETEKLRRRQYSLALTRAFYTLFTVEF